MLPVFLSWPGLACACGVMVSCSCVGVLCYGRRPLPISVALVCVCVCCVAPRVGVGGVRGSCLVCLRCVCVCVLAVCGLWGMSYLVRFPGSADMVTIKRQKKRSCKSVARRWVWCYAVRVVNIPHNCPILCVSPHCCILHASPIESVCKV